MPVLASIKNDQMEDNPKVSAWETRSKIKCSCVILGGLLKTACLAALIPDG